MSDTSTRSAVPSADSPAMRSKMSVLEGRIRRYQPDNEVKEGYYQGTTATRNLGIAVPWESEGFRPVLGWPATVVDVIAERLDFLGFSSDQSLEPLDTATRVSSLSLELGKAVTDSLIYGVGFLQITPAEDGSPLVSAVDPTKASFLWDGSGRRVAAGLVTSSADDGGARRTLYLPDRTVVEEPDSNGNPQLTQIVHGRGIAGLVPVLNRVRSGRAKGHSEITEAVRYATDNGMRTLLGMEYNREFYTTPQRYLLNAYPEVLGMSADNAPGENRRAAWKASMSSFPVVPPTVVDETSGSTVEPKMGQFASNPPTPYIEQLRALTQMIAAEAAIPVHYLGFITDNPSSADAIRQAEARLVKKAELKQRQLSQVLTDTVAPLLWRISTGVDMDSSVRASLDVIWRDAATPTKAAMADAAVKLAGAEVLPKRSAVLYDMLGISPADQRRIEQEWARDTSRSLIGELRARADAARASDTAVKDLSDSRTGDDTWGNGRVVPVPVAVRTGGDVS